MEKIICIIFMLFIINCTNNKYTNSVNSKSIDNFKLKDSINVLSKGFIESNNVFYVDTTSITFYTPDSSEINDMIKSMGEDKFYTISDDNNFYLAQGIELADSKGYKKKFTEKKMIYFIDYKDTFKVDRSTFKFKWGAIFYKKGHYPKNIYLLDLKKELK